MVAGAARPPSSAGGLREVPGAAVAVPRLGARVWPGVALYYVVLGFNLAMTAWIREWVLLAVGGVLHAVIVVTVRLTRQKPGKILGLPRRGVAQV